MVGAVIPAFGPGPELVTGVEAALAQVSTVVVVVDEHPVGADSAVVLARCTALGAVVVAHHGNRGIGAALNTGIEHLRSTIADLTHVLTLDQDSAIPEGYVAALLDRERAALARGVAVGMVAPGEVGSIIRIRRRGTESRPAEDVVVGGEPIQSGLLVPLSVLERLDGFDESLFIDGVDTDFYLRARDAGLCCVLAPGVELEHRLGRAITGPGDRELPLLVASTFRYYYQWRNLVALLRAHAARHPLWAVGAVVRAVRHLLIVTVVAAGRGPRLREAAAGLRAGLRAEAGRRPEPT